MKCKDAYLHICDNLDEQIDSPRCREIRAHLAVCPDCHAFLTSLKKTVKLYKALPAPRLPRGIHSRLLHTLAQEEKKRPAKLDRAR
jgi:anti-sigma factor RsiW